MHTHAQHSTVYTHTHRQQGHCTVWLTLSIMGWHALHWAQQLCDDVNTKRLAAVHGPRDDSCGQVPLWWILFYFLCTHLLLVLYTMYLHRLRALVTSILCVSLCQRLYGSPIKSQVAQYNVHGCTMQSSDFSNALTVPHMQRQGWPQFTGSTCGGGYLDT